MAHLYANNGPNAGKILEIDGDQSIIGRLPECELLVDNESVSRKHARIVRQGKRYYMADLHSRNGTFLNDQRINEQLHELRDGDRLRICEFEFTFSLHGTATSKPRAEAKSTKRPSVSTVEHELLQDDSSSLGAVLVDDEDSDSSTTNSTIMTKVDVTASGSGGPQLTASMEARLEALIAIMRSLGNAIALDEVLPNVLDSLFKIFLQADRGFIVLKTEDGGLVPRWTKLRKTHSDDSLRISKTIISRVMETREAILSADAANDSQFEMSQSIADFRIRSMMCAPLLDSEGKALGVLQMDTLDQRKRFQKEDLEVMASIAVQAGIAINNAQLYERALKQKEIEQDLELATQVQQGFLPQGPPDTDEYDFYDFYEAANHVGGDYYDYVTLPDGRIAVLVADVVGHGVAAAMMMAKLSAEAKFSLATESDPATVITRLNKRMCINQVDRFVTLVMAVLDPSKNEVTIVNAGHMAPIWHRADGSINEPGADISGLPIGIIDKVDYQQVTIEVAPNEMLALYTDGINEAMNMHGDQFTIDRVRKHIIEGVDSDLTVVGQAIIDDVRGFIGNGPRTDDMCLVCFGRRQEAR